MNFNPPPPQDVIQAGVNAVQELTGAGGAAAEDAGTAAQQAATAGPSTEDALRRIKQATDAVVAAMAEILRGDFDAQLQKEREALQWLKQTKQRTLKEVMAAEEDLIAAEFKARKTDELIELLPVILQVVMIVICVIAVVVAEAIRIAQNKLCLRGMLSGLPCRTGEQSVHTPKACEPAETGSLFVVRSMLSRWELSVHCVRAGSAKACHPAGDLM